MTTRPWVWGVDVSTKRLGFGFVNLLTHEVACHLTLLPELTALAPKQDAIIAVLPWMRREYPPATIAVEVPMGTHHKRGLDHVEAVTLLTLERSMPDTPPWPMNISTWKRYLLGNGNASQEELPTALADVVTETQDLDALAGVAIAITAASVWESTFDRTQLHPLRKA